MLHEIGGILEKVTMVLAEYMGWVRKLLSRLLPEFLEREVIHEVGGIHEVGAQGIL